MILEAVKTPEQILISKQETPRLETYIDRLPPRCGMVVRLRYGIRCEPRTLDEIGELYGVSRERVRQMQYAGLRKLKWMLWKEERPYEFRKDQRARLEADRVRLEEERHFFEQARLKREQEWEERKKRAEQDQLDRQGAARDRWNQSVDRASDLLEAERRRNAWQDADAVWEENHKRLKAYAEVMGYRQSYPPPIPTAAETFAGYKDSLRELATRIYHLQQQYGAYNGFGIYTSFTYDRERMHVRSHRRR